MVYTFHFVFGFHCGSYAVENLLCHRRAHPLRAGRSETSPTLRWALSGFWHQPPYRLQVVPPLPAGRTGRLAPPLAPPAHFAAMLMAATKFTSNTCSWARSATEMPVVFAPPNLVLRKLELRQVTTMSMPSVLPMSMPRAVRASVTSDCMDTA